MGARHGTTAVPLYFYVENSLVIHTKGGANWEAHASDPACCLNGVRSIFVQGKHDLHKVGGAYFPLPS